jgi:hypothetical protein
MSKVKATIRNANLVPKAQWRKWGPEARHVFNEVYATMAHNVRLFMHPKQKPPTVEHWQTSAWNAAWTAADAAQEALAR